MLIYRFRENSIPKHRRGRYCELSDENIGLPGVQCYAPPVGCGQTWGTAITRIRRELPREHPLYEYLRQQKRHPLPPAQLQPLIENLRHALNIPEETPILPGTEIGNVRIKLRHTLITDFAWPWISTIILTERGLALLKASGLTGWHTEEVICDYKQFAFRGPLCELVIDGVAGTPINDPEVREISLCPVCGLEKYNDQYLDCFEID
jgi:hypothetical protein